MHLGVGISSRTFFTHKLGRKLAILSATPIWKSRGSGSSGRSNRYTNMGAAASALNEDEKSEISLQLKAKYEELVAQSLPEVEIYNRMNM